MKTKLYSFLHTKHTGSFLQYLFCFLVTTFFIIFICITTFQGYLHNIILHSVIEANQNVLTQIMISHHVLLDEINNSLTNIIFDKDFSDFSPQNSYYKQYELLTKLNTILSSNFAFEEIFLYYPAADTVVSTAEGITLLENSSNYTFIRSSLNSTEQHPVSQFRIKNDAAQTKVVSMIKNIPIVSDHPTAYVFFDLRASYLSDVLSSLNLSGSTFLIMDQQGIYISKNNFTENISSEQLLPFAGQTTTIDSQASKLQTNYGKLYVNSCYSDKYQWTYLSLTPANTIEKQLSTPNKFIIVLTILVLLASAAISYFFSRKLYTPLRSLAKKLKADQNNAPLNAIQESVDNIITENKNLTQLLSDYTVYLKQSFLSDLLLGHIDDLEDIKAKFAYYQIPFQADGYLMTYTIKIQMNRDFVGQEKQNDMATIYLNEIMNEELFTKSPGFFLQTGTYEYTLTLNLPPLQNEEETMKYGHSLANTIHQIITVSFHHSFAIGVSNLQQGIKTLPTAYKQAKFALYSNRIVAYNNITLYNNVSVKTKNIEYPYSMEQKLTNALTAGNRTTVQQAIEQLKKLIVSNVQNQPDNMHIFYIQLLTAISKCLNEMGLSSENLSMKEAELYRIALYENDNSEDFIKLFETLMDDILSLENDAKSNQNQSILKAIKNYISAHLCDDLSTEKLSEIFYISASYLRKLFKDAYSITLKTYIDNKRIDRAKELLCDQNVKISDIPEQIGYLSAQSFTRAFKNHTGITPSEFRIKYIKRQ